jgi:hypothetical protein
MRAPRLSLEACRVANDRFEVVVGHAFKCFCELAAGPLDALQLAFKGGEGGGVFLAWL